MARKSLPRNSSGGEEKDKPLPNNLDAERSILGGIILDNTQHERARAIISPSDFFLPQHRKIWAAITALVETKNPGTNSPVDLVTLTEHLFRSGELEQAGGAAYLAQLVDGVPRISNVRFYAGIVKEKAKRRAQIHAAELVQQRAWDEDDSASIGEAISSLVKIDDAPIVIEPRQILIPDLPEAALCGKLGDIAANRMDRFPRAYSWPSVIAAASFIVRPNNPDKETIRTNQFIGMTGDVHSGKTMAMERAWHLFGITEKVDMDKAGSGEGLMSRLTNTFRLKVLNDVDEMAYVLAKSQIQNSSYPSVLCSLWSKTKGSLTIAKQKNVAFNVNYTLIGGIVTEKFGEAFGAASTAGLYDRFFFTLCPSDYKYRHRPNDDAPIFEPDYLENPERPVTPTVRPEVWQAVDAFTAETKINERVVEISLRAAMVCAAFDGLDFLTADYLQPFFELAKYLERVRVTLRPNEGLNFEGKYAVAVLQYLEQYPVGEWVEYRTIRRNLHPERYGPSTAQRAITTMQLSGAIEFSDVKPPGGGRKKQIIRRTE